MGINKENYVDQAEQVIKNLMTDRKGNITLTTSKIRNILAMVSEIYNEVAVSYTHLTLPTKRIV